MLQHTNVQTHHMRILSFKYIHSKRMHKHTQIQISTFCIHHRQGSHHLTYYHFRPQVFLPATKNNKQTLLLNNMWPYNTTHNTKLIVKLTWSTTASTIWHWHDISLTIPTTLSSLSWSSVGPNIIARFRTSIYQHFSGINQPLYKLAKKYNQLLSCILHFNIKKID